MQHMMGAYVEQSQKMFQQMQEHHAGTDAQDLPRHLRRSPRRRKPKSRREEVRTIPAWTLNASPQRRPPRRLRFAGLPQGGLVDAEQILTRLRAEGYAISGTYDGADLVVVNTCGFIDAAVEESLDAIGEALAENGKVIVTGCLGAKDAAGNEIVRNVHPKVLAVTGPHATGK
jgi:hypothetical protein